MNLTNITTVFFDFDGVFTDNSVYVDQNGIESVRCNRSDGLGINILRKNKDIKLYILSTEENPVVAARAAKLQIPCFKGCKDKAFFLKEYFDSHKLDPKQVAFVGNDLNDLEAMKMCGCAVCPSDAHPEIVDHAGIVLSKKGGDGAVREFCVMLLHE